MFLTKKYIYFFYFFFDLKNNIPVSWLTPPPPLTHGVFFAKSAPPLKNVPSLCPPLKNTMPSHTLTPPPNIFSTPSLQKRSKSIGSKFGIRPPPEVGGGGGLTLTHWYIYFLVKNNVKPLPKKFLIGEKIPNGGSRPYEFWSSYEGRKNDKKLLRSVKSPKMFKRRREIKLKNTVMLIFVTILSTDL